MKTIELKILRADIKEANYNHLQDCSIYRATQQAHLPPDCFHVDSLFLEGKEYIIEDLDKKVRQMYAFLDTKDYSNDLILKTKKSVWALLETDELLEPQDFTYTINLK